MKLAFAIMFICTALLAAMTASATSANAQARKVAAAWSDQQCFNDCVKRRIPGYRCTKRCQMQGCT